MRRITSSVNAVVPWYPLRSARVDTFRYRLESRLADRPPGLLALLVLRVREERGGEDHRHRVAATSLPSSAGAVPWAASAIKAVGRSAPSSPEARRDSDPAIEPNSGKDEVGENVAVAVERGNHHRRAAGRDQESERRVDQLQLVGDLRVTLRSGVHLLLQHSLVDRADRVLRSRRTPWLPCARPGGTRIPRPRGRRGARSSRCEKRPRRPRSPHAIPSRRTRRRPPSARRRSARVDAPDREHPWNPPSGAHVLAADLLPQDAIRRADVVTALGVIVTALRPSPWAAIARAASCTTALRSRAASPERSKRGSRARSRGPPVGERESRPRAAPGRCSRLRERRSFAHPSGGDVDGRAASHWGWKTSEIRAYNGRRVLVIYLAETASAFFAIGGNRGTKDSARL